jgi:Tfp pilus assembly protein PilO
MNRNPLFHLVFALAVLVLVLAGYGIWYSMLVQKSSEASSLVAQIAQQNNTSSKTAKAATELAQLSTQEASINQYFVATNNIVPFLNQMQAIGTFLGAKISVGSVSATPATATTPYGQVTLSLNITGSFDSVARTIGAIEYTPYDTTLTSLSFTKMAYSSISAGADTAEASTSNSTTTPMLAASPSSQWTAAAQFTVGAQTGNTQQ